MSSSGNWYWYYFLGVTNEVTDHTTNSIETHGTKRCRNFNLLNPDPNHSRLQVLIILLNLFTRFNMWYKMVVMCHI